MKTIIRIIAFCLSVQHIWERGLHLVRRFAGTAVVAGLGVFALAANARAQVCEAGAGSKCLYVAPNGSDSNPGTYAAPFQTFKPAITSAGPGDFIYARGGSYGAPNRMVCGVVADPANANTTSCPPGETLASGNQCYADQLCLISLQDFSGWASQTPAYTIPNGQPGRPITVKAYPGEHPAYTGVADMAASTVENAVNISQKSYWVIDGFEISFGIINIWGGDQTGNTHDITLQNLDIHDGMECCNSNFGAIMVYRGDWNGPYNIFILNNKIHEMYEGGYTWATTPNAQHIGAISELSCDDYIPPLGGCGGTGLIVIRGNTIWDVPSAFFFKNAMKGPILIQNNLIHDAQMMSWAASDVLFQGNVVYNLNGPNIGNGDGNALSPGAPVALENTSDRNEIIDYNTFVGANTIATFYMHASSHTITNNVVFGLNTQASGAGAGTQAYIDRRYWISDTPDIAQSDMHFGDIFDFNCLISPNPSFLALLRVITDPVTGAYSQVDTLSLPQMQSEFGFEAHSTFVNQSNPAAIFTNPSANDYHLLSGSPCGAKGAYAFPGNPARSTPPVVSGGSATSLANPAGRMVVSVHTDEPAYCRYSQTAGTDFTQKLGFEFTSRQDHSVSVDGLTAGQQYVFYVSCMDRNLNTDASDYPVMFTAGSSSTSPLAAAPAPPKGLVLR